MINTILQYYMHLQITRVHFSTKVIILKLMVNTILQYYMRLQITRVLAGWHLQYAWNAFPMTSGINIYIWILLKYSNYDIKVKAYSFKITTICCLILSKDICSSLELSFTMKLFLKIFWVTWVLHRLLYIQ